jgi:aerobic carbon-monoxide dehydrogenase large subunit
MTVSAIFGARVKRKEDPRMISGKASYVADIKLQGMTFASFVRSPHAHAIVKKIQTEKARRSAGVVAVYTGADLKGKVGAIPCAWAIPNSNLRIPEYFPIAVDKVRYVGDPVTVVVADTQIHAEDAAELVEVEYDPLPAVVNQEDAIKQGAPELYKSAPNNVAFDWKLSPGSTKAAFEKADLVIEDRIVNQRLQPTALETRGALAYYNAGTEEITLWVTSQNPHVHRVLIAGLIGVPEHKLRVISPDVGGGFGSKIDVYGPDAVIAFLARDLQRPVRWIEDRRENYLSTTHGRDHVQYVQMALKKDGTILGLRARVYANMGAWLSTVAPGVPTILFGLMLSGPYKIPAVECEVFGVLTNTVAVDAYRGAGRPEAAYILDRLIDTAAQDLKLDPAKIRLKNFIGKDEFPYTVATGLKYDSGDHARAMRKALKIVGYENLRVEQTRLRKQGRLMGIGISSYVELCGLGPSRVTRSTGFPLGLWESAKVRVHPSGKVTLFTGGHPHGQGEETTFAQIVAEELGVSVEDVDVVHGDTATVPFGMGTYGSRTTPVAGGAVALACRKITEKGKKIAAHLLEARAEDMVFERRKFRVRGSPGREKSLAEVAWASHAAGDAELPVGLEPGLEATTFYDPENFVFPFGTHICVVEVDKETGQIAIKRYVAVDDCGRQINQMIVEGQVHGGVAQGIAQALWEEAVYDDAGNLLTSTLADYAPPTAVETPMIESSSTVTPSPHNPLGVKGVGEAGTIASAQAVVNAVVDALSPYGVRSIQMPLRSDKVWKVIRDAEVSMAAKGAMPRAEQPVAP